MYSLGHGLCTLPALPRSTQPSTLRVTVKWVSASGLSNNNKWGRWMWMVDSQPKSVGLVRGLAATRRSVCIHQKWLGELSQWLVVNSTFNVAYREKADRGATSKQRNNLEIPKLKTCLLNLFFTEITYVTYEGLRGDFWGKVLAITL